MSDEHATEADAARQRRRAEFDERFGAGEFDLATDMTGYTGERGAEQQRQAFAFAAWAARVAVDPGEDFDGFVAQLWAGVDSLYGICESVGAGERVVWDVFPAALAHRDDPEVVEWGEK